MCLLTDLLEWKAQLGTYKSAEPVSKFRVSFWPPMVTGERYSDSFASGVAVTSPSSVPGSEVDVLAAPLAVLLIVELSQDGLP